MMPKDGMEGHGYVRVTHKIELLDTLPILYYLGFMGFWLSKWLSLVSMNFGYLNVLVIV